MKKIAVIGAGATGHALCAILANKGHEVVLADTRQYEDVLLETAEAKTISVSGTVSLSGTPKRITTDVEAAVSESELIVCCTVSNRDAEIANLIAPYITSGKAVLIGAGNGASIVYHKAFKEAGHGDCLTAEVAGNFFPVRRIGPGQTIIGLPLSPKGVAAYPPSRTAEAAERFQEVWELVPCTSLFEPLFNGPNLICHCAGVLCSIAAIDRDTDGTFNMFKQGMSPAVLDLTDALWREKDAVYTAMGAAAAPSPRQFLSDVMDTGNAALAAFREMGGPGSLEDRYITEDIPYLLCFFVSIARKMEVPVPLFESILRLISAVTRRDFYAEGRTLENLGLGELSKEQLIAFFKA